MRVCVAKWSWSAEIQPEPLLIVRVDFGCSTNSLLTVSDRAWEAIKSITFYPSYPRLWYKGSFISFVGEYEYIWPQDRHGRQFQPGCRFFSLCTTMAELDSLSLLFLSFLKPGGITRSLPIIQYKVILPSHCWHAALTAFKKKIKFKKRIHF